MAFGKRIKFFRNRKGMKQKELGEFLGFLGKTSDVRVAQYETEARTPKVDLVKEMAQIFGVSTRAINVPNIDSYLGLMHTLFALEDMYGIKIGEIDGELCLRLDREHKEYQHLFEPFHAWQQMAAKLESGEISQEGSVKNFVALVKNGSFLVRIIDMTILIEKEFIYGSSKRPNPTDYYRK